MKPPSLNVEVAARLSKCVHLRDIVCMGLEAKHTLQSPVDLGPEALLSWTLAKVAAHWDLEGSGRLKVVLPLQLTIEALEGADEASVRTALAEIGTVLRLEYEVKAGESVVVSDDDIRHFVGISGFLHSWPYFRADVQWLTSKLGFPPLVLPVMVSGNAVETVSVFKLSEIRSSGTPNPPLVEAQQTVNDRRDRTT